MNRQLLILAIASIARVASAATINTPVVAPGSVPAGQAATVTVTAQILDSSVIGSSVNLQQVDIQGRVTVVGTMTDDGSNGDAASGDRTYTIQFTVFQQNPGPLTYRVSAGVLGGLTRIFSSPVTLNISGATPTGIAITLPGNLTFTGISPITITGTTGDPAATVQVNGVNAPKSGNAFQASIPLQEGTNTIAAVATNAANIVSTASIDVTLDTTPPHVTIESPADGSVTADATVTVTGIVNDLVVGTVNTDQATVTVNGVPAQVANRRYVLSGVSLALGDNKLQVVASDRTGNSATVRATVKRQNPGQQLLTIVSGNNQSAPVGTLLPSPFIVQVTNAGAPVPNVPVIFKVTGNDGFLQPGAGKAGLIAVNTNAQGQASAVLTLGQRSGAAANMVETSAAGFPGVAVFSATGLAGAAAKINVDSGGNQFGAVGQTLVLPFVAVVTDASNNRLENVPVTFTVKSGGGNINGQAALQTVTDGDGRARAVLSSGPQPGASNNVVQATFPGNTGVPATFTASAKAPGDPAQTTISGIVVDNSSNPIPGVTMRLFQTNQATSNSLPIQIGQPVVTDSKGFFHIAPAPVGVLKLMADGNTATQATAFPTLEYDITTVSGQDNGVGMPIFLPALDPAAKVCVSDSTGGTLTIPDSPGFSLKVPPGSATFPGGARSGCVSVSPVNPDKIPMAPGFGQQPRFIVTIQPVGTIFNPPAAITIPNVDALAPRSRTEMYSYDHDLGAFVAIGSGSVSGDGSVVASDPGVGVLKAGWFGSGNPNPVGSVAPVTVSIQAMGSVPQEGEGTAPAAKGAARLKAASGVTTIPSGTFNLAKGDSFVVQAFGLPDSGTYIWSSTDPASVSIGSPLTTTTPIKALNLAMGNTVTDIVVMFISNSVDSTGHHPFATAIIHVRVWDVDTITLNPPGDVTVNKTGPAQTELISPVGVHLTIITGGGITQDPDFPIPIRFSFEDPDDTATNPGIDPNGVAGDDNAPVSKGGKRGLGAVMWRTAPANAIAVSADGQTATGYTPLSTGKVDAMFAASAIGGDNYILKAQVLNSNGGVMKEVKSGTWSVRKFLHFDNVYQMTGGLDVKPIMDQANIEPAFTGDGYTDYFLGTSFHVLPPAASPKFLVPVDPPKASELPTAAELADYNSTDLGKVLVATEAIEKKAMAWWDRVTGEFATNTINDFVARNGIASLSTIGIQFISAKQDGDPTTGQTSFYPPGIQVAIGNFLPNGTRQLVSPDGDWNTLQGLELANNTYVPLNAGSVARQQIIGRHEAGHASDHVSFGDGDHATDGLMHPTGLSNTFSDDSILRLRGWKP